MARDSIIQHKPHTLFYVKGQSFLIQNVLGVVISPEIKACPAINHHFMIYLTIFTMIVVLNNKVFQIIISNILFIVKENPQRAQFRVVAKILPVQAILERRKSVIYGNGPGPGTKGPLFMII